MDTGANRSDGQSNGILLGRWQKTRLALSLALLFCSIYVIAAHFVGGASVGWFVAAMQFFLGLNLVVDSIEIKRKGERATGAMFMLMGILLVVFSFMLFIFN